MVLSAVWLFSCWFLAAVFTLMFCYPLLSAWTCIISSVPISFAFGASLAYVISCVYGRLHMHVILGCLVIQLVVAFAALLPLLDRLRSRGALICGELKPRHSWQIVLILLAAGGMFLRFCYYHNLYPLTDGPYAGLFAGGSTWGDMGIHLDIMNSFLTGQNQKLSFSHWPQSPIYADAVLVYQFLPDFHSAVLVCGGWSERMALIVPSVLLGASLFALLALVAYKYTGHSWSCAVSAMTLFLLCGGVGWLYWTRDAGIPFMVELRYDFVESYGGPHGMYWFATLPHVLLPQRTALFGYPIVLLLFLTLIEHAKGMHTRTTAEVNACLLFVAVCIGSLPLLHTHSFFCCFVILAVYVLTDPLALLQPRNVAMWVFFALLTSLVAVPQLPLFFVRVGTSRFMEIKGMWVDDSWVLQELMPVVNRLVAPGTVLHTALWYTAVPLLFMIRAISLYVPLSLISLVFVQHHRWQTRLLACAWALFVLAMTVKMQPWKKDNIKILYVWLFVAVCDISLLFKRLWRKHQLFSFVIPLLFIGMTLSGGLTLARELKHHHQYLSDADVAMGQWAKEHMNGTQVIIASDKHNHPVANLVGVTTFSGFGGWLHSHGYAHLHVRSELQKRILAGVPGALHVVKDFDIGYVVIDWLLRNHYDINYDWLEQHAKLVYDANENKIYQFNR